MRPHATPATNQLSRFRRGWQEGQKKGSDGKKERKAVGEARAHQASRAHIFLAGQGLPNFFIVNLKLSSHFALVCHASLVQVALYI